MATKRELDFTNVRERDVTAKRLPTGWHPMTLIKVDDHEKDDSDGWRFVARVDAPDPGEGETYAIYCMFEENQLWKIRKLAEAVGLTVPKKRISVNPEKLLNKPFAGYLIDDDYEGRERSALGDQNFAPLDDITDTMWAFASDEDDEPAPAPRRRKKVREPEPPPPDNEPEDDEEEAKPARSPKGKTRRAAAAEEDDEVEEIDLEEL